jgi:hypothetical protein
LTTHARTRPDTALIALAPLVDRNEHDNSVLKTRSQTSRHHPRTLVNYRG